MLTEEQRQQVITELYDAILTKNKNQVSYILSFLKDNGIKPNFFNEKGYPMIKTAIINSSDEIVLKLLENQADLNVTGGKKDEKITPLHLMVSSQNSYERFFQKAQYLLNFGAEVNAQDIDGNTPLHAAVWLNDLKAARVLLEAGGNATIKNKKGETPLHIANILDRQEMNSVI